ncbi:rCG44523 [Rattus norvegicus]|uniref:RCG44523 n=1 Tax=Rattus norvegicus TaxID=10116 RepID=A6I5D1_RAT|nr:rCG44523 [Rattus norvegicus]
MVANPVTYLVRKKRRELQDMGHPRPESQVTATPLQFAYILLMLMFSLVAHTKVKCCK